MKKIIIVLLYLCVSSFAGNTLLFNESDKKGGFAIEAEELALMSEEEQNSVLDELTSTHGAPTRASGNNEQSIGSAVSGLRAKKFSPNVVATTFSLDENLQPARANPVERLHNWGERGNVGDIYVYDNPYSHERQYFELKNFSSYYYYEYFPSYAYFPIDKSNNYYWEYRGTTNPLSQPFRLERRSANSPYRPFSQNYPYMDYNGSLNPNYSLKQGPVKDSQITGGVVISKSGKWKALKERNGDGIKIVDGGWYGVELKAKIGWSYKDKKRDWWVEHKQTETSIYEDQTRDLKVSVSAELELNAYIGSKREFNYGIVAAEVYFRAGAVLNARLRVFFNHLYDERSPGKSKINCGLSADLSLTLYGEAGVKARFLWVRFGLSARIWGRVTLSTSISATLKDNDYYLYTDDSSQVSGLINLGRTTVAAEIGVRLSLRVLWFEVNPQFTVNFGPWQLWSGKEFGFTINDAPKGLDKML